ncbi:MAG TPA: hypothetical protein VM537_15815 [Anaerolineae bacterium]|nr:hypothetical protein [Anaerolineae bacterium]
MTDREMLEQLEWLFNGTWNGVRCPACDQGRSRGHAPDCQLGNHLHPKPVKGSAEWAIAEAEKTKGDSKRGVRRSAWSLEVYRYITKAGRWHEVGIDLRGHPYDDPAPAPTCDAWELYEPEPEPEVVRWKLEWRGMSSHERYLRCQTPHGWVNAEIMPHIELDGYRFHALVYRLPDGREVPQPAGMMPIYWLPSTKGWWAYPTAYPDGVAFWPDAVEMRRVATPPDGSKLKITLSGVQGIETPSYVIK